MKMLNNQYRQEKYKRQENKKKLVLYVNKRFEDQN